MHLTLFAKRHLAAAFLALLAFVASTATAWAAPSRDHLTLLIPDNAVLTSWQVQV